MSFNSPSAGSYTFLGATGVQSNVASVDLNGFFTSDYDVYKIFLSGIYSASPATIRLRVNTTGSYTTQTAGNYFGTVVYNVNDGTAYIAGDVYNSDSSFYLAHIGSSSSAVGSGEVTIYNPMSTSLNKNFLSHVFGNRSVSSSQRFNIIGSHDWTDTTAITGVRFLANTGNIYFSNIRIYGIKNS